ncbi:MAG: hypothetical protein WC455_12020 [Dehalococcoidia bacterium]|jgi:hypothetical protein
MESIFLLVSILLKVFGDPTGQPLAYTDTIVTDAGRTQAIYRHCSPCEIFQFKPSGKLLYRSLPVDDHERRYYLLSSTEQPFLQDVMRRIQRDDQGRVDHVQIDNDTAYGTTPPSEVTGWEFHAYGQGIETVTAFDGAGNWTESTLRTLDARGLVTRQLSLTNVGAIQSDIRFTRDEAGRVGGFTYKGVSYTVKYTVDSKGNWTLATVTGQPPVIPVAAPAAAPVPKLVEIPGSFSIQRKIIYPD